jgi:cytoskeletal protein RodZ
VNKQKYQSGFAHIAIITGVLAVAVVGLLGYVFWQNFMQPKNSSNNNVAVNSDKDSSSNNASSNTNTSNVDTDVANTTNTNEDTNKGYLVLDSWGVKFKLPSNLGNNQITYRKASSNVYQFSTSGVEAIAATCKLVNYPAE